MVADKIAIISIDAIKTQDNYWEWNSWYKISEISKETFESFTNNRKTLKYLRDNNLLNDYSKGSIAIDDDGYNVIIILKSNKQPILAICYGELY